MTYLAATSAEGGVSSLSLTLWDSSSSSLKWAPLPFHSVSLATSYGQVLFLVPGRQQYKLTWMGHSWER